MTGDISACLNAMEFFARMQDNTRAEESKQLTIKSQYSTHAYNITRCWRPWLGIAATPVITM